MTLSEQNEQTLLRIDTYGLQSAEYLLALESFDLNS